MANDLGKRLKSLRQEKGLLQKQVAAELGITESGYGFYEQGKRTPDSQMLKKIAAIYNVSADFLLGLNTPLTQEHLTNTYSQIAEDLGEDVQVMFHDITSFDDKEREELKNFIDFIKSKKKKTP